MRPTPPPQSPVWRPGQDQLIRSYRTNAQGLVTQRTETQGAAVFVHHWYYAGGHRIGEVYTKPGDTTRVSYAESLALLEPGGKQQTQAFKNLKPVTSADFDQNDEPINRSYPGPVPGSYVVRSGDSLRSIAQSLWGGVELTPPCAAETPARRARAGRGI